MIFLFKYYTDMENCESFRGFGYIYVCVCVCVCVCVEILGLGAHYLCTHWAWGPIQGRNIV